MRTLALLAALVSSAALAAPLDAISDPDPTGPWVPGGPADRLEVEVKPAVSPPIIRAPPEDKAPPAAAPEGGLGYAPEESRRARRLRAERRMEPPDFKGAFSLFDAETLAEGEIGFILSLGFPYLSTRVQFGISDRLDAGVSFNSIYAQANSGEMFVKYRLKESAEGDFAIATRMHVDVTQFRNDQARAQWTDILGIRDVSVTPGMIISAKSSSGSAYFVDVAAQVTFDFDPAGSGPLSGPQPTVSVGANVPVRLGAEWNLSKHANFYSAVGVDLLLRQEDNTAAFFISIGIEFMG